jgi:transposase
VRDRSRYISRLKALLDKVGCHYSGDFTTYKVLRSIDTEGLPAIYVDVIRRYGEQILELGQRIHDMKKQMIQIMERDNDMCNLSTISGIGPFSAALIKTEVIDISRFRSFNRLCAYAGLAPRVSMSANKIYYGGLNINRRKNLQWILIENVYHFIKASHMARKKFERIRQRKGHNTAKVALARDMLRIIYHVLKEKRPYYTEKQFIKELDRGIKIQSVAATALNGV